MADGLARKRVWAWALYDWGNSAFATTIIAGFFPVFFGRYWYQPELVDGVVRDLTTLRLGQANSIASIVVCVLAPMLGAVADRSGGKKKLLATFAGLGVVMTASLFWVAQGSWVIAALFYAVASIGFAGGNIFYDALIVDVAPVDRRDRISALGYALGYLGGGVLFALNVWMVTSPQTFGIADASTAIRLSFLSVSIWWLVFTLPLLFIVKERSGPDKLNLGAFWHGLRQMRGTFREIRRFRHVFYFLLAYWLYIDGVDTVIRMAVSYGQSLGFPDNSLILALLITQFVGFPAALAYGYLGERIGAKRGLLIGICVYIGATIYAVFMNHVSEFYVLAVVVGLVQGGVQALSRSYFSRLIPPEKAGEFFGFYNMLGKFAAVIGPLLMGYASAFVGTRLSILSIILLFVGGGAILLVVHEPKTQTAVTSA